MKRIIVHSLGVLLPLLFAGCAATIPPVPGSTSVKIQSNPANVKGCNLRGKVSIAESNIYSPTHSSVQAAQINQLQNQAAKIGANTVLVLGHKTKYWPHPEYIIGEGKMQWELDAHAMNGLAYSCPSKIYNNMPQLSGKISDVRSIDE